ncbi:hypothetical protein [Pseudobacteriovorax antillogorgiicola]|uniref:Uncharacterized protein n=1 Tax=Pseudobacteriovorax antillogorgiicola TaxID=1513793 RepID=A0A1Y6BC09_9BACT|nr:hypothetical protein [Pseudobacteriovorax antillogorgiicola]TCS57284.1 hypothetical protein EDD56_10324 [Pseudobacteriovorax antillogorgiicola]SMF03081.1 hypothetical protein SAMN06296036_103309 [Pseudobacteriovorax antillogorgiicola]
MKIFLTLILALGSIQCGQQKTDNPTYPDGPLPKKGSTEGSTASIDGILDSEQSAIIDEEQQAQEQELSDPEQAEAGEQQTGYGSIRIQITEMKQDCSGNTTNIQELLFKMNGEFLVDSFSSYPDNRDPIYNTGKIGPYDAQISTSGDFETFYPFEAFGGGFGGGWFSNRNSFENATPSPAVGEVWFQVSFGEAKPSFESLYIKGGSATLPDFAACAPSQLRVLGSNDLGETWVLLGSTNSDTQPGIEISLNNNPSS